MMIDKELLNILACPSCKGNVEEKEGLIVCLKCGMKFSVKDGIPVMLVEEKKI